MLKHFVSRDILLNPSGKYIYFTKLNFNIMSVEGKHCVFRLVFDKAIASINPPDLVKKELQVNGNKLCVRDSEYDLNNNCYVVGFGKCVLSMARTIEDILGKHLQSGILSIPEGFQNGNPSKQSVSNYHLKHDSCIKVYEGAKNNLPDENAVFAATQIKNLAESLNNTDILIVVISGGGSALLPLPIPPITLSEKLKVIKLLVTSGADIMELNSVRKRLSVLKGGGLSAIAYPASVITLILSDIIGDPLSYIASGPTVLNNDPIDLPSTILNKYSLKDKIPESVSVVLKQEHSKSIDNNLVQNLLIGNNEIALNHAVVEAQVNGYNTIFLSSSVEGLVSDVCDMYISLLVAICQAFLGNASKSEIINSLEISLKDLKVSDKLIQSKINDILSIKNKKIFLVFGGETTVKITGSGLGGRNQELALRFSIKLHEIENYFPSLDINKFKVSFLSAGTDGIDGPTTAAGAIAYTGQIKQAIEQNLLPQSYVDNNDSFNFFQKLNKGADLLTIGHTGVNVMDLQFLSIEQSS